MMCSIDLAYNKKIACSIILVKQPMAIIHFLKNTKTSNFYTISFPDIILIFFRPQKLIIYLSV